MAAWTHTHWEWDWHRWVLGLIWWDVERYRNVRLYLGPLMLVHLRKGHDG